MNRKTIVLQQKPLKHQTKFSLVATVSKVAKAAAALEQQQQQLQQKYYFK
jgi:hypothetical protein